MEAKKENKDQEDLIEDVKMKIASDILRGGGGGG